MPTSEQNPLARLTWFGVRRPRKAAAANTRPIRRFTNREYAGVPADGFCAWDNCATVSRNDSCDGAAGLALVDGGAQDRAAGVAAERAGR